MLGIISYLGKCTIAVQLVLSVLAIRCLSATATRTDSIFLNESISDGQNLVSPSNNFVLGFFSPGARTDRYVGIWYNNSKNTVVWVANRDNPIQDTSGRLKFDSSGDLIILNGGGILFTVAYGMEVKDVEAAILDSGNFVLRSITNNSKIIWQSFDSPTHTWLPGMNFTASASQKNKLLTSWKSYDDPAIGDYSFELRMIDNVSRLTIWWKGIVFWTSSYWNGDTISFIPDLISIGTIPVLFQCDNLSCTYSPNPVNRMTNIVLDPTGSLNLTQFDPQARTWTLLWRQPASCDVPNLCGVFGVCTNSIVSTNSSLCHCPEYFAPEENANTRKGCTRQTPLQCNGDRFIDIPAVRLPNYKEKLSVVDVSECESACMKKCSCTAYDYSLSDGCSLWDGNLTNMQVYNVSGVGTLHLRVAASEVGSKKLWMAGVFPSVAFVIFCFICLIWIRKWKNKGKGKQHDYPAQVTSDTIKLWEKEETASHFMMLSFAQIASATDNFSTENKGILPDGRDIAVKRLAANSGQGLPEFKNEILLIAKLQHRNLVGLLGCCIQGEEMVLVYEYMPNKSLDFFLFERSRRALLDWAMRINIIEGVAQGLIYLHRHSRLRIIHRDLKASNILLDIEMNPKISDFGMARISDPKGTQDNTKRVVGTYGYMAPEYAMAGIFSVKSDVFSYGVLLLEIISGIRNAGSHRRGDFLNLLGYAWELWKEARWCELMDKSLHGACPEHIVLRCIHVGLLCVQENAADRPSMTEVISMITNDNTSLPEPKQPGFLSMLLPTQNDAFEGTCSLNGLSITDLDGR